MEKRKRKQKCKPRVSEAFKKACADLVQLAQILGKRCRANGIDVSKIPITCGKVIQSHYILNEDGVYIRKYGVKKKRNG